MNAGKPPKAALARACAVTAVSALVLLIVSSAIWVNGWSPVPADGDADPVAGDGTLPARVGAPAEWTADGERDPIGAAAVLYTSNTWFFDGSGWLAGLVGKQSDTYRLLNRSGAAGMSAVLSPDGGRLATSEGITDLATGRFTGYSGGLEQLEVAPQAWSPDGTVLAVLTDPEDVALRLFRPASGEHRVIQPLSSLGALYGWTVAFSPDGSRIAYQVEDRIRVVSVDGGGEPQDHEIPPGARLAGKGAWLPDGSGLLVVAGERCDCGDYPMRWTVSTVPFGPEPPVASYRLDGAYAVRVLGWSAGEPVAAEYTAVGDAEPTRFDDERGQWDLISQNAIESVRLVELPTGRTLMEGGAESVDVPDSVFAGGRTRAGHVPLFGAGTLVLTALGLLIAAVVALLLLQRRPADEAPMPDQ